MNEIAIVAELEVIYDPTHGLLLLSMADLAIIASECPCCQPERTSPSPYHATVPQVDYNGPLPFWKDK